MRTRLISNKYLFMYFLFCVLAPVSKWKQTHSGSEVCRTVYSLIWGLMGEKCKKLKMSCNHFYTGKFGRFGYG